MIPKFRAWDKVNKKLKQVYSINFDKNGEIESIKEEYTEPNEMYAMFDIGYFELMQSTGLKDKNGAEIYEGDIVEFKYPYDKRIKTKGVIVRNENKACFGINMKETTEQYELYRVTAENYLTVIGNKYQHPRLLEGE
ncbi:YopX family protein [Staphylococcus epidermidis]|uniref:YopX family protein n=1 Tax=Staphylococcus epidermidis TaxID=1282 RepID=UPI001D0D0650|nr:YopX family protein [Staphylococcus epidermidis]MCC2070777.1 YopX family protein [Staphylococcus epidermidis]